MKLTMTPIISLIFAAAALPLSAAAADTAGAKPKGPKAHGDIGTLNIKASHGIFYRLAKDEVRKRFLLQTSVEGYVGDQLEYILDDTGREYLGTCARDDIDTAFSRFEEGGEEIDIIAAYGGHTYMDRLQLGGMGKAIHTREDGGGLKYDATGGEQLEGDGLLFTGIIDINYPDQEFEVECDLLNTDLDCEVYSVGIFQAPKEDERRLESGYPSSWSCDELESGNKDQCNDDDDCRGDNTCSTFKRNGANRQYCTCNENNDGDTLYDNYDCSQVWDFDWYEDRYEDNGKYRSRCANGAGYCLMYEQHENDCFSASMTMTLENGSRVTMKDLRTGDRILAADGKTFETVYSIPHKEDEKVATFLRLHTLENDQAPLELTPDHLVYVANKKHAVPASTVKVGDLLLTATGASPTPITAIDSFQEKGIYAPLTPSGKILVNGIVASCHQTIQANKEHVEIMDVAIMAQETLAQAMVTPLRLFCTGVAPSMCRSEGRDEESGRIAWARIGLASFRYAESSGPLVQVLMLALALFVFFLLSTLASVLVVLSNAGGIGCMAVALVVVKSLLAEFDVTLKTKKIKTV